MLWIDPCLQVQCNSSSSTATCHLTNYAFQKISFPRVPPYSLLSFCTIRNIASLLHTQPLDCIVFSVFQVFSVFFSIFQYFRNFQYFHFLSFSFMFLFFTSSNSGLPPKPSYIREIMLACPLENFPFCSLSYL